MFGAFYIGWSVISHIGAKIKAFVYDIRTPADSYTNTYIDYYGKRKDANTNQYRRFEVLNNGDRVLKDRKNNVVRNMSAEERANGYNEALRKNQEEPDELVTTFKTNERRTVTYPSPCYKGEKKTITGFIHKDLKNGHEYFEISIREMDKGYGNDRVNGFTRNFYVDVNNPFNLVRISDSEKRCECAARKVNPNNWLDRPDLADEFIKEYNSRPFRNERPEDAGKPTKTLTFRTF